MSPRPNDEVLERVYHRARAIKIRRRLWVSAPVAVVVLVVALAVPVVLDANEQDTIQVVTDESERMGPPPPPAGSVFYAASGSDAGPAIVQIDVATMSVRTTYTVPPQTRPPGSSTDGFSPPSRLRLSPDGATLYFQFGAGSCGGAVYALDVTDPHSARLVLGRSPIVGEYAPTPDGRLVWHRCGEGAAAGAIVVTNLETGEDEVSLPYDLRRGWPFLAVSPDGRTLALEMNSITPEGTRSETRLVPLDGSTSIDDAPIVQPVSGCSYGMPEFNRRTGELHLLERCGGIPGQGGRLVAVDLDAGSITAVLLEIPDDTALFHHALDTSGERLLYTIGRAINASGRVGDGTSPEMFLRRPDEPDQLVRQPNNTFLFLPGFGFNSSIDW